ncbi:MAG: hypothetical protein ABIQ01_06520 [Pseudolysinimonas sp.]
MDPALTDCAGWALIAGPVLFMIGAAAWDPRVFQGDTEAVIRNVATRRRRWTWIHGWMAAGVVGTTAGIGVWQSIQSSWPAGTAAWIAMLLFLFAAAVYLVGIAIRHGVDGAAASAISAGDPIPAGLATWHAFGGTIHSTYVYLANAAGIALGASAILADPRLAVIGWIGIAMGAVFIVGYRAFTPWFAPPFIPTVFPAVLGIALLVAT